MSLILSRSARTAVDLAVLSLALWAAFFIRFDGAPPFQMFKRLMFVWPYAVIFQYAVMAAFGIPRFSWRYVGLREVVRIGAATTVAAVVVLAIRLSIVKLQWQIPHAQYALVPIGVIVIDLGLAFVGITGVRVLRRLVGERRDSGRRREDRAAAVPTILIGAGQAGVLVAKELANRPDLGMKPVGFLDDNELKVGTVIHGVPVLGTTEELSRIRARMEVRQALITIANAPAKAIRRISDLCRAEGLPTKIIPGIYEIVGGQVNLSRIRDLAIEDLLGREPVQLEEREISSRIRGRTVVITGAGGSIGSELCRQVCRFEPGKLVLLELAENALFEIERELGASFPATPLVACVGSVCDASRVHAVFEAHRPDIVFHAAAHKHVPLMEMNSGEAVKNNVLGTQTLADIAHEHGVSAFVMVSTDKAVNPSSVMGATKRIAEIYVQALAQHSKTRFVTVRFGNVLGSAGSVIPIFRKQIAAGGPVTVTHPEMTRYFMTIPEACQLVLQAGTMGKGGEIFILDMGAPVKIVDLARDLIRLSGFVPDEEIEIRFTGPRPGEKLFEELSVSAENADKTRHPKIFVGRSRTQELAAVRRWIAEAREAVHGEDDDEIRARIARLVPEYAPPSDAAASPRRERVRLAATERS